VLLLLLLTRRQLLLPPVQHLRLLLLQLLVHHLPVLPLPLAQPLLLLMEAVLYHVRVAQLLSSSCRLSAAPSRHCHPPTLRAHPAQYNIAHIRYNPKWAIKCAIAARSNWLLSLPTSAKLSTGIADASDQLVLASNIDLSFSINAS
jgi:hypothetical protein